MKSKFAGFLRGLVGRADDRTPAPMAASAAPAPVASSAPTFPTATAATAAPVARPPANADEIEVSLAAVVAGLPLDLRAKLMSTPTVGQTIRLAADTVIAQLAFGAVKISFGELRQLAPGIFVNSGGELDTKQISLPLQEILARVNPALLARRSGRKVEVASEIVGPFAERGRGFSFTTQPLKAPAAAPAPRPEPESSLAFNSPVVPRQASLPPVSQPLPARGITPLPPTNGNGHAHLPTDLPPSRPVAPTHNGHNGNGSTVTPGLRLGPLTQNGNGHASAPVPPLKQTAPEPATPARPSGPPQPTIFAALSDLSENWPEELKNEIFRSTLAHANVPLDGALILPGLKRGRVTMTWKQLRLLAQPGSAPSAKDNLELELPLKVIAPLFLAAQKNPVRLQTKASVSAEIPDLFFGFPQPAAAPTHLVVPPLPPVSAAPAVAPMTPTVPVPKPVEAKPQDTNFYVWGEKGEMPQADEVGLRRGEVPQTDFMSRQAHPKDVVIRAAALPGVAGAVVAMQDGLRVASQVPSDLNADTLAAFLPQIYERVNQSTRELRMGALNNINFTVGNVPWKIFRVNAVYFAAFGRAGEALPSVQLAQLAGELDRKKQQ